MFGLKLLSTLCLFGVSVAVNQDFISSAEIDIAACPITYYGLKYNKVYVGFDSNTSTLCFNGQYHSGQKSDCILMSRGSADRGALTTLSRDIPAGSGIHSLVPNLKHAGQCVNVIPLRDEQGSDVKQIELGNFGPQAIVAIKTHSGFVDDNFETQTVVNGKSMVRHVFHTNKTNKGVLTDVSGCRLFGAVYKTNTSVWNADICSTVTCDEFGVATPESTCGPMERCQGNNTCTLDATCTVTASTIIDVIGQLHTVPDRCGYKLMEHVSIPDLEVFGVFQERRRKDVSFLERLVLHLKSSNVDISLEQGGRVKVNDTVLPFNTSEKVVHGVKVSKGPNGLTAEVTASDYAASIHFNGHTAQIRVTGPKVAPVFGLCGNTSTTLAQEKNSGLSESGCETTYTEDADVSINCNDTAEWCNILREQPFSTCNLVVDPQPFISACSSVLCKYPAVDGFNCQFFEAYTRACSMHNVSVEGWKSQIKCAETQAKCQNMYCSEHEFCGEKNNGWEWACLCRAIFASKYRPTNTFGEPTVCEEHTAALTLAGCLLEERGIDYSVLHMNNESCVGQMDNETHMVTFSFDQTNTCGTVVKSNGSKIIYHNTIQTWNSSNFGIISRHDDVHLDFSCHYLQPGVKSLAVRIKDSSVIQELTSGQWRYNLSMIVYTDEARRHALTPDTEVNLDQTIYIELQVDGIDENLLSLVVDSCWATTESSPNSSLKYSIVGTGCPNPVDKSVRVINNGQGLSSYFSFSLFQFTGRTGKIYLHCKTMLCVNQGTSCAPKCNQSSRRRRSAMSNYMDQNPGLITMAWRH
ncbi:alpha-tectorin-like [Periophthalmus magnuspinnatus]|uniref:alpha-tectorin-like n=1 Tax=Periophthalmus magnuspinnatus TaxID=409849 RepID=UPI0024372BC7|nr:alpha-tectorin-like [Periophthalmus magnuspinnatus]